MHLELVSDSLFYKVTQGYLDMGTEVLDHNSVSKMSDVMGRNIGEKVIEDDMRAWRFWMAFLGFGYMHDSQAGAAGILNQKTEADSLCFFVQKKKIIFAQGAKMTNYF